MREKEQQVTTALPPPVLIAVLINIILAVMNVTNVRIKPFPKVSNLTGNRMLNDAIMTDS